VGPSEEKHFCPCQEPKSGRPTRSLITIATDLFQLTTLIFLSGGVAMQQIQKMTLNFARCRHRSSVSGIVQYGHRFSNLIVLKIIE
jgi:hypothetical protein